MFTPRPKLVKVVSRLANTKAGGLLLIGFGTKMQLDSEVLDG